MDWRLHIHGDAEPALEQAASRLDIGVDGFNWDEAAERAALGGEAAYLVRPDGHVALALPDQDPGALAAYAARIGLRILDRCHPDAARATPVQMDG